MKGRNRLEGRSTYPAHSGDLNVRILRQIKTVTSEIEALQTESYRRMNKPEGVTFKRGSPAENAADARVLAKFKVSLDRLRHVLWFYIEQLAVQAEMNVRWEPLDLERDRLPDAGRGASTQTSKRDPSDPPPHGSFFGRLDVVSVTYMKPSTTQSTSKTRHKS